MSTANVRISAVDLFCGVGGLSCGLLSAGVDVRAGVDIDPDCAFPYVRNNQPAEFLQMDVGNLQPSHLARFWNGADVRLLAGCAPCQPFSTYSRSARKDGAAKQDGKWRLVLDFGRLVAAAQPEVVTMENVPQLADLDVFHELLDSLNSYNVWWDVVDCTAYGVPQTRKRLVLMASRLGPLALPPPSTQPPKTVREAIAGLPPICAGAVDPTDPIHRASRLSQTNLERIRSSRPGGTWRDWPRTLRAQCHLSDTGQTYPSVYGRMEWDSPSPTITTQCFGYGNGRFGHPEQDRAISLREAAILQTFPRDYQFVPPNADVRFSTLGRLIGNAVPVLLGRAIGQAIRQHVDSASAGQQAAEAVEA